MSERKQPIPPPVHISLGPHFARRVPDGDMVERYVCGQCGHIAYSNPKIVVGSVVAHPFVPPRHRAAKGFPDAARRLSGGTRNAARRRVAREAREEACAEIVLDALPAVHSVPHISQVQLMYRARLGVPQFAPGAESLETELFAWDDIPWNELAFPSVRWALDHYRQSRGLAVFAPFGNPL